MQPEPMPRWKISLDRYHRMIEAGVLTSEDRVQLIAGEIIPMSPMGAWHRTRLSAAARLIRGAFDATYSTDQQLPLSMADHSEPEPDVAVTRLEDSRNEASHPTWAALVVEIADTSLAIDRRKAAVYASANIPEYWILNRTDDVLEVYRTPKPASDVETGSAFREVLLLRRGDVVKPLLGSAEVDVTELLGTK